MSVVIALEDRRAKPCYVEGWTRRQTADPSSFEVIAVVGPRSPIDAGAVAALLRPQDCLVPHPGTLRSELQDAGMARCSGDVVLLTEDHCDPDSRCVEHVLRAFESDPGLVAALGSSTRLDETRFAALEGVLASVDLGRPRTRSWDAVRARCFAIRRATLEAVGGIDPSTGLFAEPELSARLHAAGVRIGRVEEARVAHANTLTWRDFTTEVGDYVDHEIEHCAGTEPAVDDEYFPRAAVFLRAEALPPAVARRAAAAALAVARTSTGALRWRALAEAAVAVLGTRVLVVTTAVRQHLGHVAARALWRDRARARAFAACWEATATAVRLRALLGGRIPEPRPVDGAGLRALDGYGVHVAEGQGDDVFRWVAPLAVLRFEAAPGRPAIELLTSPQRPVAGLRLGAAWCGRPVPVTVDGDTIRIEATDAAGELVVIGDRLRTAPRAERRRLAFAITGVRRGDD